ncbi:MAG: OmpA family protein, partial [Acidimicrobiales bacterium]
GDRFDEPELVADDSRHSPDDEYEPLDEPDLLTEPEPPFEPELPADAEHPQGPGAEPTPEAGQPVLGSVSGSLLDAFDPAATLFGVEPEAHNGSHGGGPSSNGSHGAAGAETIDVGHGLIDGEPDAASAGTVHPLEQPRVVIETDGRTSPGSDVSHRTEPRADRADEVSRLEPEPTGDVEGRSVSVPAEARRQAKPRRRWPAFAIATVIGAAFGIGGALMLARLIDRAGDTTTTAPADAAAQSQQSNTTVSTPAPAVADEGDEARPTPIEAMVATGRLELNTIRFVPGTTDLTEASLATLGELAATDGVANAPISIVVRTYSEPTAAENRALSLLQAAAITDHLVGLGLSAESVVASGIGAPPLTPAQPVQNFVVANAGLRPSALKTTLQPFSPFSIWLDPIPNQLRSESIDSLDVLGQAMVSEREASVSLAAYSFGEPDATRNQELAAVAAEAVATYLVANYEIDRDRISVLTPGQAPDIVSGSTGNHIFLQWGEAALAPLRLNGLDQQAVSFPPGSAQLGPGAQQQLTAVAEATIPTELTVVIEVHTATEATDDANARLADLQAEAIRDFLLEASLPEARLRVSGGGDLRQFQGDDITGRVVITAVP